MVKHECLDAAPADEAVTTFAARLEALATHLSARERTALAVLLLRAMDPLTRLHFRAAATLSADEQTFLDALGHSVPDIPGRK